jgi:hypothetical protein
MVDKAKGKSKNKYVMRKAGFLVSIFFFFIVPVLSAYAQESINQTQDKLVLQEQTQDTDSPDIRIPEGTKVDKKNFRLGPGMEITTLGEINIVAPRGTKVRKEGSQIIFEDSGEYLGRKFDEMESRFAKIEARQEELKDMLERLDKAVEEISKRSLPSQ